MRDCLTSLTTPLMENPNDTAAITAHAANSHAMCGPKKAPLVMSPPETAGRMHQPAQPGPLPHRQPNPTSSIIMTENPAMVAMVTRSILFSLRWDSGISSSTTTKIIAPAAKQSA